MPPGCWLEVLVGGGGLCFLKWRPGGVGQKWWQEETWSPDMTGVIRGACGIPGELCDGEHHCHSCLPSD